MITKWTLCLLLPLIVHELSHACAGVLLRVKLSWRIAFPRVVFSMDASGTDQISRTRAVLRAGFTGEVLALFPMLFAPTPAFIWYALGHAIHLTFYPSGTIYNDFRGWV